MYNEAKRQDAVIPYLRSIKKYFDKKRSVYEIIVVLDGPTDSTPTLVQKLKKTIPELIVISRKENRGKGTTVKQGILAARGKFLLFTDADGSTPIKFFSSAEKEIAQGADVVIGSRSLRSSVISQKQNLFRRIFGLMGSFVIRAPLGLWSIRDTQCGFKVFSRKAAKKIFSLLTLSRFGFDFELLVIAKAQGFFIQEIPVVWRDVGEISVNFKQYLITLFELLKVFLRRIFGSYR